MINLRPVDDRDRPWIALGLVRAFASEVIVSRGQARVGSQLPGLIAERPGGDPVGLVSYVIDADECEIVGLFSLAEGEGVGTALLDGMHRLATEAGCRRLWLVTTNDNTAGLRFYQRRGFDLVALHRNAVTEARTVKPEIPERGSGGIPIAHELELEMLLGDPTVPG
ncbi:MAG: GNAT family N-acetyltransferase [Chloroflexi bacterium]|nr:GNAT family N-acetyltransferase [Chloroflexota bacterium]